MAVLNIVLVEPRIPENTGNIARTCAVTGARLHLVKPLGFEISDKHLKRAGLDYWHLLDITYYEGLDDFFARNEGGSFYYFTSKGPNRYTDVAYQEGELEKTSKAVQLIHDMIVNAFQVISAQPLLLPVYRQMIESVVITLPNARQYETVLDDAFDKIQQELSQPTPVVPSPDMIKVEQQKVKNAQEYEVKKEQNRIKADEVALKHQIEENKVALTNKEMEYQAALKEEELRQKVDINSNITTGYVRGF